MEVEYTSLLCQTAASEVKLTDYVYHEKKTCRVTGLKKSKTGKHGKMKVVLTLIDITSSQKFMPVFPGHTNIYLVDICRRHYEVVNFNSIEEVEVMDSMGEINMLACLEPKLIEMVNGDRIILCSSTIYVENDTVVEKITEVKFE